MLIGTEMIVFLILSALYLAMVDIDLDLFQVKRTDHGCC